MLSHLLSSLSSFSLSRRSIFPISLTLVLTSYLLHRYRHIRTAKHPTLQPCISSSLGIYTTRTLYYMIPISIQHKIRDSGLFAHISDKGAIIGGFFTLLLHPHLITDLITHHDRIYHIAYGEYDRCILDVYHHTSSTSTSPSTSTSTRLRPIIIFIHGGAWGSGNKLMYRLYAYAMAKYTQCIVVCLQYRVYPTASISLQLADISAAISWCHLHATSWGGDIHNIYLMGHSSGAHLAVLNVVERAMKGQHAMCAGVIGLAGVYDIIAHYDFEAMRGVHEISPMKPAAGGSRDSICISAHDDTQMIQAFTTCSPTLLVPTLSPAMRALLPPICLIHGELDTTVPITSSQHLLHQLHQSSPHPHLDRLISCSHADHASLILDVMLQTGEMWRDHILAITSFISDVRDANQRTHHDTFNEMHHRIQQQLHIPAAL